MNNFFSISGINEFCEEDENIVFSAIKDKVFSFLRTAVIAAPHFFEEVCIHYYIHCSIFLNRINQYAMTFDLCVNIFLLKFLKLISYTWIISFN